MINHRFEFRALVARPFAQHAGALFAACMLAVTGSGEAEAAVPGHTAEQVVRESGLAAQVQELPGAVAASLAESAEALGLPTGLTSQLQREGRRAFEPMRLLSSTVSITAHDLDAPAAADALRWWRSAAGQQIRALENEAVARQARDPAGWLSKANATYAAASPARRTRLDAIERATQAAELTADLQIQVATAVLRGIAAGAPPAAREELRQALEQLQRQKPLFVAAARGSMLATFAACYATAQDADLDRYLAYLQSPEGRHATIVLVRAVSSASSDAAADLGRSVPALLGGAAR